MPEATRSHESYVASLRALAAAGAFEVGEAAERVPGQVTQLACRRGGVPFGIAVDTTVFRFVRLDGSEVVHELAGLFFQDSLTFREVELPALPSAANAYNARNLNALGTWELEPGGGNWLLTCRHTTLVEGEPPADLPAALFGEFVRGLAELSPVLEGIAVRLRG